MVELLEILDELKQIRPTISDANSATIIDKRIALLEKQAQEYDVYCDELSEKWEAMIDA
jgi:hypothetical protein